jgi:protein-L-isoaspartate(D-aspartate) O-methyltransferase
MLRLLLAGSALLALAVESTPVTAADEPDYTRARLEMVYIIQLEAAMMSETTGVPSIDQDILAAMVKVPRHIFVLPPLAAYAYEDMPLPAGYDQNITQPFLAALMTQLLQIERDDVVFETGTDSGYQAAVLAELGVHVYSMEVIEPLAREASERLHKLGYGNIAVRAGDGYYGWSEHGPYDAILIKEAINHVPPPLLGQLKPGGRMVLPLGPGDGMQMLTVIDKAADGSLHQKSVLPVRFAPMQGGERI